MSRGAVTRSRVPVVGALMLVLAAAASEAPAQGPALGDAFVRELVAAINSKSPDRRKALLHPKALPCASGESGAFYQEIVARQARRTVPATSTWKITPVPPDQPLMFAEQFDYPVRPTHLLQLDFPTGPQSSTTMILQLARDGSGWREVIPCPKPETLAARAKHSARVRALVAGTPSELRETVVRLFNEGRRVEAFKHYASVSGEDLATAKDVVELLAAPSR